MKSNTATNAWKSALNNTFAIFAREFRSYFLSPIAYIVITVFLLPQSWFFYVLLGYLCSERTEGLEAPMSLMLGSNIFLWLVLFATAPAMTMKLLAEEKRSGTIEMLLTSPVTDVQIVLGKYLAAVAMYVVMWLPTLAYVVVVWKYGNPDMMKIVVGYVGMLLAGAMFLSFGMLASSLTRNQITAYIVGMVMCVGVLFLSIFLGNLPGLRDIPGIRAVLDYFDLLLHMSRGFSQGIIDTRNLVYYLSMTILSLYITVQVMATRKIS